MSITVTKMSLVREVVITSVLEQVPPCVVVGEGWGGGGAK